MNNDFTFQKMLTCIGNKRKLGNEEELIGNYAIFPHILQFLLMINN